MTAGRAARLLELVRAAALAWLLWALALGGYIGTAAFACACAQLALERARDGAQAWTPRRVFLAAFALYLSTFRWRGGDDIPASLLPFSILRHGTLALNPVLIPWLAGKEGDFTVRFGESVLSVYPVTAGILALPLYLVPVLAGAPISEVFLHQLSKVGGAAITAASAAFFFAAVSRRCTQAWAARLTLVYAAGTWAFSVSSQALWQHGPAQLGLAIALWGLYGSGRLASAAAGFGMALAAAARPDSVFLALGALAALAAARPRRLAYAVLGAAVPCGRLAAYWLTYTGALRPPESRFQAGLFTGFQPEAFAALLLSPTRGLLWFSPAALFGVWAGSRRGRAPGAPWLLAGAAATWIFFGHYANWFGGMTFGTRYWASLSVVLLFLCADAEAALARGPLSKAFAACAAVSIVVHALGAYLNWPGRFDYAFEGAHAWDVRLHPWLDLLSIEGSLRSWPMLGRWSVFIAVAIGAVLLGRRLARLKAI